MAFVSAAHLELAVSDLRGKHPLAVVVLPAMVRAGVDVADRPEAGSRYGSSDELRIFDDHFRFPGGLPDRPYRAVWEETPSLYWRDARYPGRSLQRMRKDRVNHGRVFLQHKAAGGDLWSLRPNCGPELLEETEDPVLIVALAVWYGRTWDVASLDEQVQRFLAEFPLAKDALIDTVYNSAIPDRYSDLPLMPDPLTPEEIAEVIGAVLPAPVVELDIRQLTASLHASVADQGFIIDRTFIHRIVTAWIRSDIIVLVGQPGTGKTRFSQLLAAAIRTMFDEPVPEYWIAVHPDLDQSDLIGYVRLDGEAEVQPFAQRILLSETPLGPHVVVLDEFNLEAIETYFSPILVASQDERRRVDLPAGRSAPGAERGRLPIDTLILATCNAYLDEPETRRAMSAPSRRRCTILVMPNVLRTKYLSEGPPAIGELANALVQEERNRVQGRIDAGLSTAFDNVRLTALATITGFDDFSVSVRERLTGIVRLLLDDPTMGEIFTMGLLRDLSLELALAERDEQAELEALGSSVANKIVHQLRGARAFVEQFGQVVAGLPNESEILDLLSRMQSGPGDDLLALV